MNSVALMFFDGERLLLIFAAGSIVTLVVISLLCWGLFRYFRPRIGKSVGLVATVPFLLLLLAVTAEYVRERPNSGPPREVPVASIRQQINGLPPGAHFEYSGLAYFNRKLYATTNIGLFEFSNGKLQRVFCPQKRYCVTSGPWVDEKDHLLWVMDDETHELLDFDGEHWQRMAMPTPGKGYYSRGDVLDGSQFAGDSKHSG